VVSPVERSAAPSTRGPQGRPELEMTAQSTPKALSKVPWSSPDIEAAELAAVQRVLDSGWLGMGPKTREFEAGISAYTGARHSIVVNNGTSALLTAFLAHGIGPGDEVLVPTYTFVATVNALLVLGATPILLDCNPSTLNVDPELVERVAAQHPKAKALVFVDVAGQPCDIVRLREIAERRGLVLIEDAAEAFGATYRGHVLGSYDHTTIFSFHIAKQLTTIEGGAVVTGDPDVAERARLIRSHGEGPQKYVHVAVGLNFRPTDIQSAIGVIQLGKVDKFLSLRDRLAHRYMEGLANELRFQEVPDYVTRPTWMIFVAFCRGYKERDAYNAWLNEHGVDTRIPWPPVHAQPFYASRAGSDRFPGADSAFSTVLSLPIGNGLSDAQIDAVIERSREYFEGARKA